MIKPSNPIVYYIALLICAIAVGHIKGQDEMRVVERDALSITIPNPIGETPFLEFNNQNGRYLGIYIPLIYQLQFHWREGGGLGNMQLDSNILSGLWHYTWDKSPNPQTGDLQGPNKFSILGFSLWDNQEEPVQQPMLTDSHIEPAAAPSYQPPPPQAGPGL